MTNTKYMMVPVEPTDEMVQAASDTYSVIGHTPDLGLLREAIKDAIAAVSTQSIVTVNEQFETWWLTSEAPNGQDYEKDIAKQAWTASALYRRYAAPTHPSPEEIRNVVLESAAERIEQEGEGWGDDSRYRPHYVDMAAINRAMKYQPAQPSDDAVDAFLSEVRAELIRAREKLPGDRIMTIALAEEFGGLCKAVLDESSSNVRKEAVQTAVMCARVVLDGDGSVNAWRNERGLDPLVKPSQPSDSQSLLRGRAQDEEPRVKHSCNMGVGCEEYGVCYANAHGEPDRCGRSESDSQTKIPEDDDDLPVGYVDWYNHHFARQTVDMHRFADCEEAWRAAYKAAMQTQPRDSQAEPSDTLQLILREFPLFEESGLCETEHCCEWSILQDRKRLHLIIKAAMRADKEGVQK